MTHPPTLESKELDRKDLESNAYGSPVVFLGIIIQIWFFPQRQGSGFFPL